VAIFSMSPVLEDILPNTQSPIMLPPSLVCLYGLDISSASDSVFFLAS
jgi:hypothetical protein